MQSLIVAAVLAAAVPESTGPLVFRSYAMPDKQTAARTIEALHTVLWFPTATFEGTWVGRAEAAADGSVVVVAPREIQAGVASFIEAEKQHPEPQPQAFEVRYWVIEAHRDATATATATTGVEVPSDLQPLLANLTRGSGSATLKVRNAVRLLAASSGESEAQISEPEFQVKQRFLGESEPSSAEIDLRLEHETLRTKVHFASDQPVVLGSSNEGETTLYYFAAMRPVALPAAHASRLDP